MQYNIPKPVPPHRRLRSGWRITVLSKDGQRLIFNVAVEDQKEVQGLATEARSADFSTQIWIAPPAGESYPWD